MKSKRCVTTVKNELNRLGLNYKTVQLGEVVLKDNVAGDTLKLIDIALKNAGFELIIDRRSLIVERIKNAVHQLIYLSDDFGKPSNSDYISKKVNLDYTSLSHIFSNLQGITIEKYIIAQKIERVKELLVYEELSLADIAYKLQYSSVAHLSNQFKKVTGLTPSFFRQRRNSIRLHL